LNDSRNRAHTEGSSPFGAPMPFGASTTTLYPDSLSVGTSLKSCVRFSPQVASRRSLPALTFSAHDDESASASTWPPISATSASEPPLYAMWLSSMPAASANSSMPTCVAPPTPELL
jgi:hypothetical protein